MPVADLSPRPAVIADLDALVRLENRCFSCDAQSRRSLRHLLTRGHAWIGLIGGEPDAAASVILLFRRGATVARLYSIAVDPVHRGRGLAAVLLAAAERTAREAGCTRMRCEVRRSNRASRALFASRGYRTFTALPGYYPGGEDGMRLERDLMRRENNG